jgi:hypothetical protein
MRDPQRSRVRGRAGGHVTDGQRNEAKAARGVFAAMARRTREGGRAGTSPIATQRGEGSAGGVRSDGEEDPRRTGASLGTNSQPLG